MGMMTTRMARCVIGPVAAAALGACSTNPTTGRSQLVFMSAESERSLGQQAAPQLTQEFGGRVQNTELNNYITEIGNKLKDQTEVDGPKRVWEFTLLDSDVINAFALPGEKVFISRGLADKLTNEAQLAGVLGHEIGHVMARHSNERMSQGTLASILGQGAAIAVGAAVKDPTLGQVLPAVATQGGQLVVLKFSREQESEADVLGMRYMSKCGYDPRGQMQVMEVLKAAAGSGSGPEWMATHPLPQTRIDDIRRLLAKDYANTQNNPNYQLFPERYEQRYLSIARRIPEKKQAEPKTQKKTQAPMGIDDHGRQRMLAEIVVEDPTTWCALCRETESLGRGH
ncbi:MAG: M48 family metallopeptidase [Phycisphaerales bacterium]|nr:M48 family metallopeptidase [Phycisphaerales bacterium]